MASIFISYASPDKAFALRLANNIQLLGHSVWIDLWEIGIGDSPLRKIGEGIDRADYVVVILSRHTPLSSWVDREVQIKYYEELSQGQTVIFPLVIEDCIIPPFLRAKRFADFRKGYEIGFAQLAITLHERSFRIATSSYQALQDDNPPFFAYVKHPDLGYNSDMVHLFSKLTEVNVELAIPSIGKISGTWRPDEKEQHAAWELYIELVTRVSVVELGPDEGLLRESLSSLHALFGITRDILHKYGPAIARPKNTSDLSFGHLAINILNFVLRPIVAKWHPLLLEYEHSRNPAISTFEHERNWEHAAELRQLLNDARLVLTEYTQILAQVANVPHLISKR